jgi:hypothetical protein
MATLTYWKCKNLEDAECYSIRARTKREAAARRVEDGEEHARRFSHPYKVVIEYADAFDLADQLVGWEGGREPQPPDECLKGTRSDWLVK